MHVRACLFHNNSGHADRRTVAGRALGDLVRKLGDTVSITDTLNARMTVIVCVFELISATANYSCCQLHLDTTAECIQVVYALTEL
jgi:hypothetical protein